MPLNNPPYQGQSTFATRTAGNLTTNSNVFTDLTDITVSLTTRGGTVLLFFSATYYPGTAWKSALFRLVYDDVPTVVTVQSVQNGQQSNGMIIALVGQVTGLAAGSHTFKVQWCSVDNGITHTAVADGTNGQPQLLAVEIPV